jgi:hypothetical protein
MSEYKCPVDDCEYSGTWMGVTTHHSKKHGEKLDKSEYLIDELNRVVQKLQKTPTRREYDEFAEFSSKSCVDEFGSWNNMLREAGFDPHSIQDYSEQDLIEELQRLEEKLGRSPYYHEMKKYSKFSVSPYKRKFGSWNDALREADIDVTKRMGIVSDDYETQRKLHDWQKSVKKRDDYTCQDCGSTDDINAHHIKKKSKYPEKMFDVDNGVTVCIDCHAERHKNDCCYHMLKSKAKALSSDTPK